MPDEIGWLTPEEEAALAEARAEADKVAPLTEAERLETERDCEAAKRYRLERDRRPGHRPLR